MHENELIASFVVEYLVNITCSMFHNVVPCIKEQALIIMYVGCFIKHFQESYIIFPTQRMHYLV